MASTPEPKPPRNQDKRVPKREGEQFPGTATPETGRTDRDRDTPLPEEETYEREPTDKRQPQNRPRREHVAADRLRCTAEPQSTADADRDLRW